MRGSTYVVPPAIESSPFLLDGTICLLSDFANMLTPKSLPLVDLSRIHNSAASSELRQALLSFGAFRLAAPQITHLSKDVFQKASAIHLVAGMCTNRAL